MSLSSRAQELYDSMMKNGAGTYYSQQDLEALINVKTKVLMELVQELMNFQLMKLVTQNGVLKFSAVQKSEAEKVSKMTEEEKMIYGHIEAAGRDGIWQKIIKVKTNLHQHVLTKSLKSLEQKRYIKSIKDVKHSMRKIYMLYNLQPSMELTGGPWFTDNELDIEFVETLLGIVWNFISRKSYPNPFPKSNVGSAAAFNKEQCSYASQFENYPTLDQIKEYISGSGVTTVELSTSDIRSLCEVLEYEDKVEYLPMLDCYRATWQSILENGGGIGPDENPMALKETPFSLFDFYTQIDPAENDPDVLYLDSWLDV